MRYITKTLTLAVITLVLLSLYSTNTAVIESLALVCNPGSPVYLPYWTAKKRKVSLLQLVFPNTWYTFLLTPSI